MKNTLKYFGLFALALTTAVSCYKEDAKIGEAVRIAVTPEPVQLTAEGKTPEGKNFQAVVFLMRSAALAPDLDWDIAVSGASYATVKKAMIPYEFTNSDGKKFNTEEAGFELTVAKNTEYRRSFEVKISAATVNVEKTLTFEQLGLKADASVTTDTKNIQFRADGGEETVNYVSNMGDVVAFTAKYEGDSKDWLSFTKNGSAVVVKAAKWTDKTKGRKATMTITVGSKETSLASVDIPVEQLSADDIYYMWGPATKLDRAASIQMTAVTAGVCTGAAFIYPSKSNVVIFNKNTQSEAYPVYYLAKDGKIKESSSASITSDAAFEYVGCYQFTLDFNTMTWTWDGANQVATAMPLSQMSNYGTHEYEALGGGKKTWMTECLHWDGGSAAPSNFRLGCPMSANAGGGYGSTEPVERTVGQAFDAVESGGNTVCLDAESNKYGRLYSWPEVLTGVPQAGCATSYDVTAWPKEYCEGKTFVDAVGQKFTMGAGITALEANNDDTAVPTLHMQIQGICPFGWHVANLQDYRDLFYAAYKTLGKDASSVNYKTLTAGDESVAALLRGAEGWAETPVRDGQSDAFGWKMYPCGRRLYKSGWSNYGVYFESWVCHPGQAGSADHITGETVYKVWRVVTTKASGTMKFNGTFDTGNGTSVIRCVKNYEID